MVGVLPLSQSAMHPVFGRALTPAEKERYKNVTQQALGLLGKQRVALIAHAPSFPSLPQEDTGVGTPLSRGGRAFLNFAQWVGFNRLQMGPNGMIKPFNPSPYNSSVFSRNPLLIDLDALAHDPDWAGLIEKDKLAVLKEKFKPSGDPDRADYGEAFPLYDAVLHEAWGRFRYRQQREPYKHLGAAFSHFKQQNRTWLNRDGLYSLLSTIHGNDYWPNWPDELDRNLFNPKHPLYPRAKFRIANLLQNHYGELEYQRFVQFVAHRQWQQFRFANRRQDIKTMGDSPIAFSDRDVWAYRNLFLDDLRMGAPPDEFAADGQPWGFHVLDPDRLTTIGKLSRQPILDDGGRLLKAKFDKMFAENPGGVRVDHVIGLIDPWVYSESHGFNSKEHPPGRLYSSPEREDLSRYSVVEKDQINESLPRDHADRVRHLSDKNLERYATVLGILTESAKFHGVALDNILCEDIGGDPTLPVRAALEKTGLGGVRVTQFSKEQNLAAPNWATTGSHDNEPLLSWAQTRDAKLQAGRLAAALAGNPFERYKMKRSLSRDPQALASAKLVELFASPAKSLQIFFTDFLGMTTPYNQPGTVGDHNWTLRIPQNFERFYYDQLIAGKGLNLPEALATALKVRGEAQRDKALTAELQQLAAILKTPE